MRRIAGLTVLMLLAPVAGQAACTVPAPSGVVFGVYQPFIGIPQDITGTVTVTCTAFSNGSGTYTVKLSIGGGTTYAGRRMSGGGVNLPYQLYSDSAHAVIWGDGTGGSSIVNGSFSRTTGGTTVFNVFGRIPTGQGVKPNAYTDTITVTVTY